MAGNTPQDLNGLGPLMTATGDCGHSDLAGTDERGEKHNTSPASLQAVKNTSKRMEKMRQQPHVIMFNQSGMPTVVSSGVSGQLQHVSVVGHVQRLPGPSDGNTVLIGGESDELPSKKKATSFKITNVYLSRPPSNDGEDSCDDNEDLEDSHTEDLSDIADSLSSQLETVAALNSGLQPNGPGSAVWNRNSQQISNDDLHLINKPNANSLRRQSSDKDWEPYQHAGFGFVTFHQYPVSYLDKGVVYNSLECSPEMADSNQPVNIGHQDLKTKFKVVKVETTQPLKRGRWTCIDFTDKHTTPAPAAVSVSSGSDGGSKSIATSATSKTLTRTEVERHYSGGGPGETVSESALSLGKEQERQVLEPEFTEERQEEVTSNNKEEESEQSEHTLTVETYLDNNAKTGVTLPHDPVNSTSSKSNLNSPGSVPESSKGKGLHIGLCQQQSVPVITATPHSPITNTTGSLTAPVPDVTNLQKTIGQVIRLNDGTLAQVALAPLPPQQQLGNVIPNSGPGQIGQQQQQQQQQQPVLINAGQYMVPQPQVPPQPMQPQHQSQSNPQQSTIIQQSMKSSTNQQQNLVNYPPPGNIQQQMSSVGPHVPMQHQNTSMSAAAQLQQMIPPVVSVASSDSSGPGHPLSMMQSQFPAPVSVSISSPTKRNSIISVSGNIHQSRPVMTSSSQAAQHGGVAFSYIQGAGAGILSLTGDREGGLVEKLELELGEQSREVDLGELDSASGASQGSIDHRIEQAMDLVKSHLMAAVRTEVDELRDKISKLEDTVSFLSRENEFLRAHVSPEVLSNLPGPRGLPSGVGPDTTSASLGSLQTQNNSGQSHS